MQEYDQVQGIATAVTLRRARVVMFLGVPLHAALAFWFAQFQAPIGQPNLQDWADALTELQVGIALAEQRDRCAGDFTQQQWVAGILASNQLTLRCIKPCEVLRDQCGIGFG